VPYRGYTLKEITLVPAPQRPPVECWQPIQSGSERAFDFMAKYGISGVIGGGSAEGRAVERHILVHRHARLLQFGRRQPPTGRSAVTSRPR
jgi:hypothetical protein